MKRTILVWLVVLAAAVLFTGCAPCPAPQPAARPAPAPAAAPRMVVSPCPVAGQTTASSQYPSAGQIKLEKIVPEFVFLNSEFTYRIEATNIGKGSLENVVVTDTIAPNVKINSMVPQAQVTGNVAKWALGTLKVGEQKTITVKAVATGPATISECATVTYDQALCAEIRVLEPKVAAVIAAPKEVLLCDNIPIEYTITNTGNAELCAVNLAAVLPSGTRLADPAHKASATMPTLAAGQSQKVTMLVRATAPGTYTFGGNLTADGGITAQTNTVTVNVVNCDLRIETSAPELRFIGREARVDVKVTNAGNGVARDTAVVTTAKGAVLGGASDGGVVAGDNVTWKIGALQPGQSRSFTVNLNSATPADVSLASAASAYCCPTVTTTARTKFTGIAAILLEVIDVTDPVEVGTDTTYIITVTNQGTAPDTNVRIMSRLDANMQYVSASGPTAVTFRDGTIQFAPIPSLEAGRKVEYRVVVRATRAADARFHTELTSDRLTTSVMETESTHFFQ
ncbi:MAG TPA: CARDB domain-containing protein [Sedimentisphaerales bacterium]|nr:CARDB domain-containing protein [Sedimentisphaerales bacterium]